MNKAILIGRLTKDPEVRTTTSGVPVTTFTLAVNRNFKNQAGEYEADFILCVAYRKQAENIGRYVGKGSKVAVEGRIQTRSYENNQGQRVYVTEIICDSVEFLDSKRDTQQQSTGYQQPYEQTQDTQQDNIFHNSSNVDISEDDLPF